MTEEIENVQQGGGGEQSATGAEEVKQALAEAPSQDAKNLAMLLHLLGIVGFFAPLLIWIIQKDKYKFVDEHGKAAMNYHISLIIYYAAALLSVVMMIGFLLVPALVILHIVLVIIATIKASNGELYQYPIAIKFLK